MSLASKAKYTTLSRQSPLLVRDVFLERKSQKKKRRGDDDDDDDDEDSVAVFKQQPGKGGNQKPSAAAKSSGGGEFDLKKVVVAFEAPFKKLTTDLANIKIGKADTSLLANVVYDGSPLVAIAQVNVRDPQTLTVSPYDTSIVPKLTKIIQAAVDPSITLNSDGKVITVPLPKPTPEYKRNLIKMASTAAEKAKVDIRNARRDQLNDLKALALPKDENKMAETQIQKAHDDYIKKIDTAMKSKEQELSK